MKISEIQKKLENIKKTQGDIETFIEVTEQTTCSECGDPKENKMSGELSGIYTINTNGKMAVWFNAESF